MSRMLTRSCDGVVASSSAPLTLLLLQMQVPLYHFDRIFSGIMIALLAAQFLVAWRRLGVFIADKTARSVAALMHARVIWDHQHEDHATRFSHHPRTRTAF